MITLQIKTSRRSEMLDITEEVRRIVDESGVKVGLCTLFVPHTTAAVTINENADPDVVWDMLMELDKIVPAQDGYKHYEGNSAAHLKSSMMGSSEQIILDRGQLVLGTWQGIYFCEFDGPRMRKIHVHVQG